MAKIWVATCSNRQSGALEQRALRGIAQKTAGHSRLRATTGRAWLALRPRVPPFWQKARPTDRVIPATAGIQCTVTATHAKRADLAAMKDRIDKA